MPWNAALETFCELVLPQSTDSNWIIVGSVASVLQNADMQPNDLDVYVQAAEDVLHLADRLATYSLTAKCPLPCSDEGWLSSLEEPCFTQTFSSGFSWTKGRWKIHDFSIEVVQISDSAGIPDSDTGNGIWEGGKYIWPLAKNIDFGKHQIPVVPLEIQLESNLRRNRKDRADAIIQALKNNGYDKELLARALSKPHQQLVNKYFV